MLTRPKETFAVKLLLPGNFGLKVTGTQGCRDSAFSTDYILEGLSLDGSFEPLPLEPPSAVYREVFPNIAVKAISVYDVLGKEVIRAITTREINLSALTSGVYVSKLQRKAKLLKKACSAIIGIWSATMEYF